MQKNINFILTVVVVVVVFILVFNFFFGSDGKYEQVNSKAKEIKKISNDNSVQINSELESQ